MDAGKDAVPMGKLFIWTLLLALLVGAAAVAAYVGSLILGVGLGIFLLAALIVRLFMGGKSKAAAP